MDGTPNKRGDVRVLHTDLEVGERAQEKENTDDMRFFLTEPRPPTN